MISLEKIVSGFPDAHNFLSLISSTVCRANAAFISPPDYLQTVRVTFCHTGANLQAALKINASLDCHMEASGVHNSLEYQIWCQLQSCLWSDLSTCFIVNHVLISDMPPASAQRELNLAFNSSETNHLFTYKWLLMVSQGSWSSPLS